MSCKICFNNYDHSKHKPYQLSCPHTYCINCLNKLKSNKCPACNLKIVNKNPNIAVLELITESEYDNLKKNLTKNIIEINNSKNSLALKREIKLKEHITRLKSIKNYINKETTGSIELLRKKQFDLNRKINLLEDDLIKNLFQFNIEEKMTIKISKAKNSIETNQLDEQELAILADEIEKIKTKINQLVNQIDLFQRDYEFILKEF
jgi:hypothetical protein